MDTADLDWVRKEADASALRLGSPLLLTVADNEWTFTLGREVEPRRQVRNGQGSSLPNPGMGCCLLGLHGVDLGGKHCDFLILWLQPANHHTNLLHARVLLPVRRGQEHLLLYF
jgi:hypothetical protein